MKLEISMPNSTTNHLEELQQFFNEGTASTIAISIEIMYWIKQRHEEGFIIKAEKEDNKTITEEEVPIIIIRNENAEKRKWNK